MARKRSVDLDHVPECPGVYLLTHAKTRDQYVGSSYNLRQRLTEHLLLLRRNTFQNARFLALCREHGTEFKVRVLETTEKDRRRAAEQRWILKLKPSLNRSAPGPDRDTPVREPVGFRLSEDKLRRLESIGDRFPFRVTMTQLIEAAIDQYLEQNESAAKPKHP